MVIAAVDLFFVDAIASSDSKRCPAIVSPTDEIDRVSLPSLSSLLGARVNDSLRTTGIGVVVDQIVLHMVRARVVIDVATSAQTTARSVDPRNVW